MIKYSINKRFNMKGYEPFLITDKESKEVEDYHKSFDEYSETELVELTELSACLGVKKLYVKDESSRFDLNAFKVLGASFAIGKIFADLMGEEINDLPFKRLKKKVQASYSDHTLVATTDGNHGRGVAWMGKKLGLKTVIFMPKGTTQNRLNHIKALGAEATITEMNYDDTVKWVAEKAQNEDWLIVQDTAWEGYESVPLWIKQGYATMAKEITESLGDEIPTHIFLQAGVGAFAGIMSEAFYHEYMDSSPKIIVVEADAADCFYQSTLVNDKVAVKGELSTIMAGLACGEPNPLGYKVLSQLSHTFVSVEDTVAANGMRILGNPLGHDKKIISGESGAVSVGLIDALMRDDTYKDLKEQLDLNQDSVVLTISTEGDTDAQMYRDIVWYGKH